MSCSIIYKQAFRLFGLFLSLSTAQTPDLVPYANPMGLSQDLTSWLAVTNDSQANICKVRMFNNINIPEAAIGTVIASQSRKDPDYAYNWVRDAAFTMDSVYDFYTAASNPLAQSAYEAILFQYAQARASEQNDRNTAAGLGEPRFYLNNSVFTRPWGRPQNDGPAESATTLMEFANAYLDNNGSVETVRQHIYDSNTYPAQAPVQRDLLYVATNWSSPSFDLWEEESSDHFFNRIVSHRPLRMGATFAVRLSDSDTSILFATAANAIGATLSNFWDSERQLIVYELGPVLVNKASYKDIAVILGVLHGYAEDGMFSYTNDQVLASAFQISTSFLAVYPIAKVTTDSAGLILGIPVGRYPDDVYNGTDTEPNGGNPWFLATATMAEMFYHAAYDFQSTGNITVSATSLPFWTYFAPTALLSAGSTYHKDSLEFQAAILALEGWADAFMRRIKFHFPADGRLAEEYNRIDGVNTGATDLTWSYASVLKAAFARAKLMNNESYVTDLANLGF
ncbi:hypothetical protein EJ08DRAFT_651407 [Tothia fuscella]|uniref:glucan 1,4-alpha-glucosidase n=1 Tax=Tothia fuscella TaxID=1048955 RepID=A0A9P4NLX7_9PEZI|nr:hypothetical protein EJ08DRAFT_651407 [Tothia fuscella]